QYRHQPDGPAAALHPGHPWPAGAGRGTARHPQALHSTEAGMSGGRLEGRVALVVGSARGIGRGIAGRFAEEGAVLVLADTEAEAGSDTASALGADFIRLDISSLDQAEAAVA